MEGISLGDIINLQGLIWAIPLIVFAVLMVKFLKKLKIKTRKKPGQFMRYEVKDATATECRGKLGKPQTEDIFHYKLEDAMSGGWYIHFLKHNATQQQLDTVFLIQFEEETPAVFSLRFIREAFGMKEPVIGESLLDDFFAKKLDATRVIVQENEEELN